MTRTFKISLMISLTLMVILFTTQSLLIINIMGHIDKIGYLGKSHKLFKSGSIPERHNNIRGR